MQMNLKLPSYDIINSVFQPGAMFCVYCNESIVPSDSLIDRYPEWRTMLGIPSPSSSKESSPSKGSNQTGIAQTDNLTVTDTDKPDLCSSPSNKPNAVKLALRTESCGPNVTAQMPDKKDINKQNNYVPDSVGTIPAPSVASSISATINRSNNLFDMIASSRSAIDFPMCKDCTDKLIDVLDTQLGSLEEECRGYRELLEQVDSYNSSLDLNVLRRELDELQNEESALKNELGSLEAEEAFLEGELKAESAKVDDIEQEEKVMWQQYRDAAREMLDLQNEHASLQNQLKHTETQLDRLQRTNAFNIAFHIWHNGQFGTINGLRLGRLPVRPVDWSEINAAWGQVVLLLTALCRKMTVKFARYEPVPFGSHSFIRVLPDAPVKHAVKELPLHCTGGYKFFWNTNFDSAMVAFLDCLQQLRAAIEKGDRSFCMPYKIVDDKLIVEDAASFHEYSVKIQFNSEERWTKAMKCMLTNLKWALAWVASLQA